MQASVTVKTDFPATVFIITVQGSEAVSDTPPACRPLLPGRTPPATVFCLPTAPPVPKSHSSVHEKATGRTECPFPYTRYNRTYHPRALVRGPIHKRRIFTLSGRFFLPAFVLLCSTQFAGRVSQATNAFRLYSGRTR